MTHDPTLSPPGRHRRLQLFGILLGLVLILPALGGGFMADDYLQMAQLEGWSLTPGGPFDLYSFVPRDAATVEALRQRGVLPYFAAPGLKIAFLRPLSSGLLWLDHVLFGRSPFFSHLHTALWYGALLVVATWLLRRTVPTGLATLGILLFCLDDGHAMVAGWAAARNASVSCVLVFLAFLAHVRWRTEGWRPGIILAPLAAALGLAAGEMALGALAYVVAWEWVQRHPHRLRALAPTLAIIVGYLVIYRITNSGAHASGEYLDPLGDPGGFVRALPGRLLLLSGSLLVHAPVDLLLIADHLRTPLVMVGAVALLGVIAWLPGALRRMPTDEAKAVRWLGGGAAGAVLVSTPALLGERVLLAASLGGCVVVAALLLDAWRAFVQHRWRWVPALGIVLLGLPHVALAAVALPAKTVLWRALAAHDRRLAHEAEISSPVPARVVVLALADLLAVQLPALRVVDLDLFPGARNRNGGENRGRPCLIGLATWAPPSFRWRRPLTVCAGPVPTPWSCSRPMVPCWTGSGPGASARPRCPWRRAVSSSSPS